MENLGDQTEDKACWPMAVGLEWWWTWHTDLCVNGQLVWMESWGRFRGRMLEVAC